MTQFITYQSAAERAEMQRSRELHRCAYIAMAGILALSIATTFTAPRLTAAIGAQVDANIASAAQD